MPDKLNYNGRKPFGRKRKLTESPASSTFISQVQDLKKQKIDERQDVVDKLFTDLSKTFIKGEKLRKALSEMDPAQYILIEENADQVSTSANRLFPEQSRNGTAITYSMYTSAIDSILAKQWELRLDYTNIAVPSSKIAQNKHIVNKSKSSSNSSNLIDQFIEENGAASIIIGMLTLSPFQSLIFQSLTVEEGAKGVQTAQIAPGIALLLELGIKADRIIKMMKSAKIDIPLVEQQVQRLSSNPDARAQALQDIGIDSNGLTSSTYINDSQTLIDYVSEYYVRYGGLAGPQSHLTLDHWISYSHVARNQQTIRSCLNTSDVFSSKFREIRKDFSASTVTNEELDINSKIKKSSKMSVELVSVTRALRERSDDLYDDIVDAFQYLITDRDMCCMVQIFGANNNTGLMKTIASLLRLLAVDLSGELVRIDNMIRGFLGGIFQNSLFEIAAQINELYEKIVSKITKMFTIDIKGLESCGGMLSIGWALLHTVRVIFEQLESLIAELSHLIGDYGQARSGSWHIAADRRHLLGIARILEVLADRIEAASVCEKSKNSNPSVIDIDNYDKDGTAIHSILEDIPPVLKLSVEDEAKYFDNRKSRKSTLLKYNYGIKTEQNNSSLDSNKDNCSDSDYEQNIKNLIDNFTEALKNIDE